MDTIYYNRLKKSSLIWKINIVKAEIRIFQVYFPKFQSPSVHLIYLVNNEGALFF